MFNNSWPREFIPGIDDLYIVISMISRLEWTNGNCKCEICLKEKMTLELIHSYVCVPMQNYTPNANRYVLTFIDDKSRYCTVYFLRKKVINKIIEFVARTATKFGEHMKSLRTDRGRVFCGKEVQLFWKQWHDWFSASTWTWSVGQKLSTPPFFSKSTSIICICYHGNTARGMEFK